MGDLFSGYSSGGKISADIWWQGSSIQLKDSENDYTENGNELHIYKKHKVKTNNYLKQRWYSIYL